MPVNLNDPRVLRTRRVLRDALVELILERGYDSVTVLDIAERADLRRATFYVHYKDKEALLLHSLEEILDELFARIRASVNANVMTPEAEYAIHLIIFQHAQQNADLYRALLAGQGAYIVTRHIRTYTANEIRDKYRHELRDMPLPIDVLANALASLKMTMALWWLEQGMPYTAEHMADMCMRLTLYGALGTLAGAR
jgi:AcrR family transcriptional regulator